MVALVGNRVVGGGIAVEQRRYNLMFFSDFRTVLTTGPFLNSLGKPF